MFLRFQALGQDALALIAIKLQEKLRVLQQENDKLKNYGLFRTLTKSLKNLRIRG